MAQNQLVVVQISNASALVRTGDFRGAESALQKIASTEGDKALIKALSLVPPSDLSQILVGTATLPSAVCSGLITPETFVKALLEVPKTWQPDGEEAARLQLQELFFGVVMRPNEDGFSGYHASKFFKEIAKNQVATELLAFYLSEKVFVVIEPDDGHIEAGDGHDDSETEHQVSENPETMLHPSFTEKEYQYQEGDWDHLAFLTRKVPDLLSSLQVLWREGIPYERFLPSIVTSTTNKSVL
jgi:hypothetical protein